MKKELGPFFEPESVAIIGASATPHKPGNDVIKNILANAYAGKLFLVLQKFEECATHETRAEEKQVDRLLSR